MRQKTDRPPSEVEWSATWIGCHYGLQYGQARWVHLHVCTKKKPTARYDRCDGLLRVLRQRPTLPLRCQSSTIGAVGLNFCVRNGNRCFPHAMATGNVSICGLLRLTLAPASCLRSLREPALSSSVTPGWLNAGFGDHRSPRERAVRSCYRSKPCALVNVSGAAYGTPGRTAAP